MSDTFLKHQRPSEIVRDMDFIRSVCAAGHALRTKHKINTRQPLRAMQIMGAGAQPLYEAYYFIALEELNIKEYGSLPDGTAGNIDVQKTLWINRPLLGKRLKSKLRDVIQCVASNTWTLLSDDQVAVAGEVLNKRDKEYKIIVDVVGLPENIVVQKIEGYENFLLLDITITQDLKNEGIANNILRHIQVARKNAGLQMHDKISVHILTYNDEIQAVWDNEEWRNYIRAQALICFTPTLLCRSEEGVYQYIVDDKKKSMIISLKKTDGIQDMHILELVDYRCLIPLQ